MEIFFFVALALSIVLICEFLGRRKFAGLSVVKSGVEYSNNYQVLGVGYYHAASRMWFPHPWNAYREDSGYYWDGTWHKVPDQRMVAKSTPDNAEVERVNHKWRKAELSHAQRFGSAIEHEGFGTASRRSEGS